MKPKQSSCASHECKGDGRAQNNTSERRQKKFCRFVWSGKCRHADTQMCKSTDVRRRLRLSSVNLLIASRTPSQQLLSISANQKTQQRCAHALPFEPRARRKTRLAKASRISMYDSSLYKHTHTQTYAIGARAKKRSARGAQTPRCAHAIDASRSLKLERIALRINLC